MYIKIELTIIFTSMAFKIIGEVIKKRKFDIYRAILYIVDNCRIIKEDSTGIKMEIDLDEHKNLLENLTNSFFTKKISTRKVENKIGHAYYCRNPFLTLKIYNSF